VANGQRRAKLIGCNVRSPCAPSIAGRIVKRTCEGSLIEFRSVVDAVRCAIEVQGGLVERNVGLPPSDGSSFASAFSWATWLKSPMAI
jgi:class 3 adenylate cyclase